MTHRITDESPQSHVKQVRRFGLAWRIAHLCLALSVMLLVLTGMAEYYAGTNWTAPIMLSFGNPNVAVIIHRASAAIMLSVFFLHLIGVATNIARSRRTFKWFGPDSLLPNRQDFKDIYGMFRWFFGKGPRPAFDRWTYWEKFDYWAAPGIRLKKLHLHDQGDHGNEAQYKAA